MGSNFGKTIEPYRKTWLTRIWTDSVAVFL